MRLQKFYVGLSALALMCSCAENEIGNDVPNFTNGEAYMSIRLADAGSLSRGTSDDNDYAYGTNEQAVKTAHFYFYDNAGKFVAQGSVWDGGSANTATPDENIEFSSNSVVVLKGLTGNSYPKYVVTVLNKPSTFTHGETLEEMGKELAGAALSDGYFVEGSQKYFTMTTTSYVGNAADTYDTENHDNGYYFATVIDKSNFSLEPINLNNYGNGQTGIKPVTIYVERLATKVSLVTTGLTQVADADLPTPLKGKTVYEISSTVAGMGNVGGGNIAAEKMYITLDGWRLNGTAKETYMSKNINTAWTFGQTAGDGWEHDWNKAADKRSFWGMAYNYDNASMSYPATANDLYPGDVYTDKAEYPLSYFALYKADGTGYVLDDNTLTSFTSGGNNIAYCEENTNTSAIVSANFPSSVTSVIVAATAYDKDGNNANFVRYNGILFTEEAYLKNIMANVIPANLCKKTVDATTNTTTYQQVALTDVQLVDCGSGVVKIEFTDAFEALLGTDLVYVDDITLATPTETGNVSDTEYAALETAFATHTGNGYKAGLMYYDIPVEHINNAAIVKTAGGITVPEGKYGVVRNHWYQISITKLEHLGVGIYDPTEKIVPEEDEEKYYLGAAIHILSWKIVTQNAEL